MTREPPARQSIRGLSVLRTRPQDAGAIAALHAELFDARWDETSVRRLLEHPAGLSFIAALTGREQLVGFLLGHAAADEAEILSVGVAPRWQRQGIGRMLVQGLCRAARMGGAKRVFLEVAVDNTPALALYRALGFSEVGRRKAYYGSPGGQAADALQLARTL
jgi:ribosomal-protein-alanine N-acetyltransferase